VSVAGEVDACFCFEDFQRLLLQLAQRTGGEADLNEALRLFVPEPPGPDVGQLTPFGLAAGVGDFVAGMWSLVGERVWACQEEDL